MSHVYCKTCLVVHLQWLLKIPLIFVSPLLHEFGDASSELRNITLASATCSSGIMDTLWNALYLHER